MQDDRVKGILDTDKIALIAQNIVFTFEDSFHDKDKQHKFSALFDTYLAPLDPNETMDLYELIVLLGRKNPSEFERMLEEMRRASLIFD
jgi:hypothetical protein